MIALTPHLRVRVAVAPVDFRAGIDGLAQRVRQVLMAVPISDAVFVFRDRRSMPPVAPRRALRTPATPAGAAGQRAWTSASGALPSQSLPLPSVYPGWPSPSVSARGLRFNQYAGLPPYRTRRWSSRRVAGRTRCTGSPRGTPPDTPTTADPGSPPHDPPGDAPPPSPAPGA